MTDLIAIFAKFESPILCGDDARHFLKAAPVHRQSVADLALQIDVGPVQIWTKHGGRSEIGTVGHDAEAAREPAHAFGIDGMRLLASGSNGGEDLIQSPIVDRQPVAPVPACDGTPDIGSEPLLLLSCRRFLLAGDSCARMPIQLTARPLKRGFARR